MNPNALIVPLNQWGEAAWGFTRPMLIQSTLVIMVLWLVDAGLRKFVSARVRHTLLLLTLVKLVLPPSFGWPVSPFYWVGGSAAPAARVASTPPVTVSYSDSLDPAGAPAAAAGPRATPSLSLAGGAIFFWALGVAGLAAGLARRARLIRAMVARSRPAPETLVEELRRGREQLGLRREVRLRVTDEFSSPAVCGLWRPVVLLPERLIRQLSPAGARAVLLHELTHVQRGDLWLNCAQTILQIIYWFHPLFWLANASIRRVREQAVDETVMEALRDESDCYPETLLTVARQAIQQPRLALGLMGILESRQALRQRLDRLMGSSSRCFARRGAAWQALALLAGALLLPMARGGQQASTISASGTSGTPESEVTIYLATRLLTVNEAELRALGMEADDLAASSESAPRIVSSAEFSRLLARGNGGGTIYPSMENQIIGRVTTGNGHAARITSRSSSRFKTSNGDLLDRWRDLDCELTPVMSAGKIELSISGKITDSTTPEPGPVGGREATLGPLGGVAYSTPGVAYVKRGLGPAHGSLTPGQTLLTAVPGPEASGARMLFAVTPTVIDAKLLAGAVASSALGVPSGAGTDLVTRVYDLGGRDLAAAIRSRWDHSDAARFGPDQDASLVYSYFTFGLNPLNDGLEVLYHDQARNRLVVRGPGRQLEQVERKLKLLLSKLSQLVIEARWAEIPANATKDSAAPGAVGLLSASQAAFVVDSVKATPGAKLVSLPKVVTLERRQTEIQVSPGEEANLPAGLKLRLKAVVAGDQISLGAEFAVSSAQAGAAQAPPPRRAVLFDGQTLMVPLGFRAAQAGEGARHSFLLITLVLIDPAGNRVHTDDQLASLKTPVSPEIDW